MTNDEIRTMKINKALLVCGHHPQIIVRLKPYYKNKAYLQYSQLESPDMDTEKLAYVVPLLFLKAVQKHDYKKNTLTIILYSLATPRDNLAMEKICGLLNDTETVFPGSNLTLAFKMATF